MSTVRAGIKLVTDSEREVGVEILRFGGMTVETGDSGMIVTGRTTGGKKMFTIGMLDLLVLETVERAQV